MQLLWCLFKCPCLVEENQCQHSQPLVIRPIVPWTINTQWNEKRTIKIILLLGAFLFSQLYYILLIIHMPFYTSLEYSQSNLPMCTLAPRHQYFLFQKEHIDWRDFFSRWKCTPLSKFPLSTSFFSSLFFFCKFSSNRRRRCNSLLNFQAFKAQEYDLH